jgi:hypothetical protein
MFVSTAENPQEGTVTADCGASQHSDMESHYRRIEALEKALREILRAPIHMAKDLAADALDNQ